MAYTFSEIKKGLDDASTDIVTEKNRGASGVASLTMANNDLAGLPTKYGWLSQAIADAKAAAPTNPAILNFEAQWNLIVADYNAEKTKAQARVTAVNNVG